MTPTATIRRYRYGSPYPTEGAVLETPLTEGQPSPFSLAFTPGGAVLSCPLAERDLVLGLGQAVGPQNRRGRVFENWCSDEPHHTPEVTALYGAHPYLIVEGAAPFLAWIDYPGHIRFDVGHTLGNRLEITLNGADFELWILDGAPLPELVKGFRGLLGKPYLPPKWGLGYQQCRWSYTDREQVLEVARQFEAHRLPLDAIYLDIDYMERYKDFTVDPEAFPNPGGLVETLGAMGLKLVPIIDAGVKIEEGYPVYEEGRDQGFFCTDAEGKPFVAAVWPGRVHFPDFLNPEARRWFGDWYRVLLELGFEGFWNDMNEPAIFYTEAGLEAALDLAAQSRGKNLDIHGFFNLQQTFESINNRRADYKAMFHTVDGRRVCHDDVHNLYGMNMTRAAAEGFQRACPDRRVLMFSRASAIGAHRWGGIWTGDNHAWWEHLLLNVRMMPALNFCGFLYSGADTGGFAGDTSPELLVRWFQFSLFTPLFRNHAAMGTRRQEPYAYDPETVERLRRVLQLRYALIPWLYSEILKAADADTPLFRPLVWSYGDGRSREIEDQLLLGDALMLAPVVQPGVSGRLVWLPEPMALWKAADWRRQAWAVCPAGDRYIPLALDETPVFLRPDALLVTAVPADRVAGISVRRLTVTVFLIDRAQGVLLDDDGVTLPLAQAQPSRLELKVWKTSAGIRAEAVQYGRPRTSIIDWHIIHADGRIESLVTDVAQG